MEKERSIKELLELMVSREDLFFAGLCGMKVRLRFSDIISVAEFRTLNRYFKLNLPKKKFTDPYYPEEEPEYCFPYGEWEPRKKWLNEQIEKL